MVVLEFHTSDMGWHNHRDNHIHTNKAKIEESIVEANASIALIVCHILIFFLYSSDSFCSLEMSNVSLSSSSLRCSRSLSPLNPPCLINRMPFSFSLNMLHLSNVVILFIAPYKDSNKFTF